MIFDLVYESRDGVRVHLTIAIHQHADLVARCHGIHHAGLHRSTVAEIVWQPQDLCARSFCQRGSGIRRAVINDEQVCAGIQRAHFTDDCADILSLVIGRYDDERSHSLLTWRCQLPIGWVLMSPASTRMTSVRPQPCVRDAPQGGPLRGARRQSATRCSGQCTSTRAGASPRQTGGVMSPTQ